MRTRVSQVAASIPIIGYLLLWSERANEFLAPHIGLKPLLTVQGRMLLIYIGAVFLTAAWLLFLARCPKEIRRHPTVEDYVAELKDIRTGTEIGSINKRVTSLCELNAATQKKSWREETFCPVLKTKYDPATIMGIQAQPAMSQDDVNLLAHANYYYSETLRPASLLWSAALCGIGGLFLLVPSGETAYLVIRHVMLPAIGITI
jgi:hypothetical protein